MLVEFYEYDREETEIEVIQDTMSEATLHISIDNDGCPQVKLYMSVEDIEDFLVRTQKALDRYKTTIFKQRHT